MRRALYFLILPLLIALLYVPLKQAWGPYYIGYNSDPAYLYLINGLDIALLRSVHHVDNPGTTAQLLSGLCIKTVGIFRKTDDLAQDVIVNPEMYLGVINGFLFSLCLVSIFLLGIFVHHITGSVGWGIFFQSVPFVSWQLFRLFLKVSPEPVLFVISILWIILLMKFLHEKKDQLPKNYLLQFSFLGALSIATKLTFLPFLLIPLFLLRKNFLIWYLLFTAGLFHVMIFPAWKHYDYFIDWGKRLFLHSGQYGNGPKTIVDVPQFFLNMLKLVALEHTFFAAFIISIFLLLFVYFKQDLKNIFWKSREVKALSGLTFALILQLMMISKHYNPHYLIPSLVFFPLISFLNFKLLKNFNEKFPVLLEKYRSIGFKIFIFSFIGVLFFLRHFIQYLPNKTFSEWIKLDLLSNIQWLLLPLFLIFLLLFFLKKNYGEKFSSAFLNYLIITIFLSYQLRHIDLPGLRDRFLNEKKDAENIIHLLANKYHDHAVIYGDCSSSLIYALKYGASQNFPHPEYYEVMQEIYGGEAYFWQASQHFQIWDEKILFSDLLLKNEKWILETDKRFVPRDSLQKLQNEEAVILKKVFDGENAELFVISPANQK